ncbi:MAG: hypothetical protein PUP91_14630 [Rhizonema sp. PD37]|nr:hypothetical protein [Rhizonema sp. PD37]
MTWTTTYSAICENRRQAGFGIFIPSLNQYGDTSDIVALIASRPLHLSFGTEDKHSPISHVRIAMRTIEKAYKNCQQNFTYFIEEKQGHLLSEQMWEHVIAKFLKYLPPN